MYNLEERKEEQVIEYLEQILAINFTYFIFTPRNLFFR